MADWVELHDRWAQAAAEPMATRSDWLNVATGTQLKNGDQVLAEGAAEVADWMGHLSVPFTADALTAVAATAHLVTKIVGVPQSLAQSLFLQHLGHIIGGAAAALYELTVADQPPPAQVMLTALESIVEGADPVPTATDALRAIGYLPQMNGDS